MSRSKSKRTAPKYQRAKLCALPVLLAVLGYVLVDQFGGEDEDAPPAIVGAPAKAMAPAVITASSRPHGPAAGTEPKTSSQAKLADWSELASTHRAELNPFVPIAKADEPATPPNVPEHLQPPELRTSENKAAGAALAAKTTAEVTAAAVDIKSLSQQPVRYFFQANNRRVMLVGDRLLSEGQSLNSYTVTHLEPNRIELEPTAARP